MRQNSLLIVIVAGLAQAPGAVAQFSGSFNAQPGIDLSGAWSPAPHEESTGNPAIADFLGVPITEGARAVGLAWSPSRVTVPEHQCQVHVAPYLLGGPLNLRIWEERDNQSQKLEDIRMYISTYEQNRIIWMDNRPHPPEAAAHTWMGFSTGKWEGNTLTVYTTHMKAGYLRRNGLPESDQATLIEHFMRHGDFLVHVSEVTDPVDFDRAVCQNPNISPHQRRGTKLAVSVRVRSGNRQPATRRRTSFPSRPESICRGICEKIRHPRGSDIRRRRDDVSGIPAEDEGAGIVRKIATAPRTEN